MDIRMPGMDGLAATENPARARPPARGHHPDHLDADEHVLRALRAGASGFLLKDTQPAGIVGASRAVAGRRADLSPTITAS